MCRTADELSQKNRISSEQSETLVAETDRLNKEIKRLEVNIEMKNNEYQQLKVLKFIYRTTGFS
jgi:hypothetical protein